MRMLQSFISAEKKIGGLGALEEILTINSIMYIEFDNDDTESSKCRFIFVSLIFILKYKFRACDNNTSRISMCAYKIKR